MKLCYIFATISASVIAAPINHPHSQHLRHPQQRQYHEAQRQPAYAGQIHEPPLGPAHQQPIAANIIAAPQPESHWGQPQPPQGGQAQVAGLHPGQHPGSPQHHDYTPPRRRHASPLPHSEQDLAWLHPGYTPPSQNHTSPLQWPPQELHSEKAHPGDPYHPQHLGSPQQQQHHGHTTSPGQGHASSPQERPLKELHHWEQALAELRVQPAFAQGQDDAFPGPSHLAAQGHDPVPRQDLNSHALPGQHRPLSPATLRKIDDARRKAKYRAKYEEAAEAWRSSIDVNVKALAKIEEASKRSNRPPSYWAPKILSCQNAIAKAWGKFDEHTTAAISASETEPSGIVIARIDESIQSGIAARIAANKAISNIESGVWH